MPRLVFAPGQLHQFIVSARSALPVPREQLATRLGISGRTLADWQREKYLPDQQILTKLSQLANIPLPVPTEIREDWWSGHINGTNGARKRFEKYGCSFTIEQRSKGGKISQLRRKENPEYYRALGCTTRKKFTYPSLDNPNFSEFIGIMLGDGHLGSDGQFSITLNSIADKKYIGYVINLITQLFGHEPSHFKEKNCNAVCIYLTGMDVTDFLVQVGMQPGNKVKQQVDVPGWIKESSELSRWCTRGLMDTDGGIFTHTYLVNGKTYSYLKTCFSNMSQPLRRFVFQTLLANGLHPTYRDPKHVWLYSDAESRNYLNLIGSSNYRLLRKIE